MTACAHPVVVYDVRRDNNWYPPEIEKRPRCKSCGWQGKWRKDA